MILRTWAARHGVSFNAVLELEQLLGVAGRQALTVPADDAYGGASESRQQSLIRLEAAEKGVDLFRNNVGALKDARGIPVRYGLANESKKQNELIKSADLIGWRTITIQQQHVGQLFALFTSREAKHEGWVCDPHDPHTAAQITWMNLVNAGGGDAAFATGPGTL